MNPTHFTLPDNFFVNEIERAFVSECYTIDDTFIVRTICTNEEVLISVWENTTHFVAGNIQAQLMMLGLPEQMAWNIYVVFEVKSSVSVKTKSRIESDKFCCKKYVISNELNTPFLDVIKQFIPFFGEIKTSDTGVWDGVPDEHGMLVKILKQEQFSNAFMERLLQSDGLPQCTDSDAMKRHLGNLMNALSNEATNG